MLDKMQESTNHSSGKFESSKVESCIRLFIVFKSSACRNFPLSTFHFPLPLLLLLLLASSLFAQDISIKATVNPAQIHIGDRFLYHIEVDAPESLAVDLPSLVGNLGNFEVKDMKVGEVPSTQGRKKRVWDLSLSTFIGGDFLLSPQEVIVWKGADTIRTRTEPVPIRVLGRIGAQDEDVLDIEVPLKDPHTPWWVWLLVGLLAAVALFFVGRFLWKRLRKMALPPPLPPYDDALRSLAQLRGLHLLESGNQAEYFFAQGQILRRYLYGEHHYDVLDATTQELRERVQTFTVVPLELRDLWLAYCQETDMVKFAKVALNDDDCRRLDTFADKFLLDLRPVFTGTETKAKEVR